MKSKKSNSKKPEPYNFNISSTTNCSIPLISSIKSSRETASDASMSDMDYAEWVALMANKLLTSHINSRALKESTMPLVLSKPPTIT